MTLTAPAEPAAPKLGRATRRREVKRRTSLFAHGEPMVWLTGGSLSIALIMITGLLLLVLVQGGATFWPQSVQLFKTHDKKQVLGQVVATETYTPDEVAFGALGELEQRARELAAANDGLIRRRLIRTGNFDLSGSHFRWLSDFEVESQASPEWAVVIERLAWGRFYGMPRAFRVDGESVAEEPGAIWERFREEHAESRARFDERKQLESEDIGEVNHRLEAARLALREVELAQGTGSDAYLEELVRHDAVQAAAHAEFEAIREEINALNVENDRFQLIMLTAQGQEKAIACAEIVRAFPPNQLSLTEKVSTYLSRWWEFLVDDPREANSEGGVYPAIFGTVAMTMIMSLVVVPFGVLAALYLREYAKQGVIVSMVRIAVNNLAGVPSIVFGVFGLGFFCYIIGAGIDELFYGAKLPNPTFGKGGLLWASLTLALLTLPVVIVATEEALAAVPSSMREGSYACGATKWQTIRRIVLPRAAPGIMTGMILAIARGAGEVAPLMLVGAVKLAPELPIAFGDWSGSFGPVPTGLLHADRSFMHLGFHIFDLGFQSQNSEAAKPMVYTTTLLLIAIIVFLNLFAVWIRARLRRKYSAVHV